MTQNWQMKKDAELFVLQSIVLDAYCTMNRSFNVPVHTGSCYESKLRNYVELKRCNKNTRRWGNHLNVLYLIWVGGGYYHYTVSSQHCMLMRINTEYWRHCLMPISECIGLGATGTRSWIWRTNDSPFRPQVRSLKPTSDIASTHFINTTFYKQYNQNSYLMLAGAV